MLVICFVVRWLRNFIVVVVLPGLNFMQITKYKKFKLFLPLATPPPHPQVQLSYRLDLGFAHTIANQVCFKNGVKMVANVFLMQK